MPFRRGMLRGVPASALSNKTRRHYTCGKGLFSPMCRICRSINVRDAIAPLGDDLMATVTMKAPAPGGLSNKARELMEAINSEAGKHNIWVRTQANAPAQRPWFSETRGEGSGQLASGLVAANQMKTLPHMWPWKDFSPYLHRISEIARKADISPIEFADRQSILLLNPALNGRLQVTNTIRC